MLKLTIGYAAVHVNHWPSCVDPRLVAAGCMPIGNAVKENGGTGLATDPELLYVATWNPPH